MAKKIEEPDVKKECPSCGLGVSLDSKICEFCGWDFEEEDEWILQIEKLERELMLEKRKFEPGSVEQRIEATLYTPTPSKPSVVKTETATEQAPQKPAAAKPTPTRQQRQAPETAPKPKTAPVAETIEIDDMRIRSVRGGPEPRVAEPQPSIEESAEAAGKVRRVRSVRSGVASYASSAGAGDGKSRKVRVVRKVKK